MATSGEGRWSQPESVWCGLCGLFFRDVEIIYDDDDNSWYWECPECGDPCTGQVGE